MVLSTGLRRPKYAAPLLWPTCLHRLSVPAEFAARLNDAGGEKEGGKEQRGRPAAVVLVVGGTDTGMKTKDRPRFIKLLQQEDLEKMKIPEKFVQQHLTEAYTNSHQNAIIVSPLGKFCRMELEREQLDVLLRDGWAAFLAAHDLSEGNILLFRYEGNMVFTVEVFLQKGCLKEYKTAALYVTDGSKGPSNALQQSVIKVEVSPVKRKRT